MSDLVLSLFPGIGLLDRAFEEAGFCVVRGPDLLWGGDVKEFHPPPGKFAGIIGGPPCQAHSSFSDITLARGLSLREDLIPEFARVVLEAQPLWFLMENVRAAPDPITPGYSQVRRLVNARHVGSEQNRVRAFVLGIAGESPPVFHIQCEALEPFEWCNAVLASGGVKPGTEGRRGRRRQARHRRTPRA